MSLFSGRLRPKAYFYRAIPLWIAFLMILGLLYALYLLILSLGAGQFRLAWLAAAWMALLILISSLIVGVLSLSVVLRRARDTGYTLP